MPYIHERRNCSCWLLLAAIVSSLCLSDAFTLVPQTNRRSSRVIAQSRISTPTALLQSSNNQDEEYAKRTSFDEAGASLIDEEDRQKMDQMGDFDMNPEYKDDSIAKMRASIQARAAKLGIEKSQATADYIAQKREEAIKAGPRAANEESFGGLDLSKISATATESKSSSNWDESMPTMFYDPEDEMTQEEKEEADPLMKENPVEQATYELSQGVWPSLGSALLQVFFMVLAVVLSTLAVTAWDDLLRQFYTNIGFIPTKEAVADYASRFENLDLPKQWLQNINEQDVASLTETMSSAAAKLGEAAKLPDL
ncbi:hypothetical protein MPSEU_000742000 [Mayamaea pseudoterrestris]|nr:hypothetical protein MPSEU_000742000 [Mayamaea pseudoterrestris]